MKFDVEWLKSRKRLGFEIDREAYRLLALVTIVGMLVAAFAGPTLKEIVVDIGLHGHKISAKRDDSAPQEKVIFAAARLGGQAKAAEKPQAPPPVLQSAPGQSSQNQQAQPTPSVTEPLLTITPSNIKEAIKDAVKDVFADLIDGMAKRLNSAPLVEQQIVAEIKMLPMPRSWPHGYYFQNFVMAEGGNMKMMGKRCIPSFDWPEPCHMPPEQRAGKVLPPPQ